MSLNSHRLLDAALFAHFEANKHLLGGSLEAFSEWMVEINAVLPIGLRTSILVSDGDLFARMDANGKRLRRYQDERQAHRMPAALALLFLEAIKRRAPAAGVQCATEISRSIGSLYVPVPDGMGNADVANMGRVVKEFGEFVISSAPMVEDGRLDETDAPFLDEGIRQTEDLIAAALAWKAQLVQLRASLVVRSADGH